MHGRNIWMQRPHRQTGFGLPCHELHLTSEAASRGLRELKSNWKKESKRRRLGSQTALTLLTPERNANPHDLETLSYATQG